MDTLIITLIAWIAAHSNLAAAGTPDIHYVQKHSMKGIYAVAAAQGSYLQLEAFYVPGKAAVYLQNTWRADDLRDKSVLLHELVHHLQAANHVKVSCMGALERQAYDLQFKWLGENGVKDPYNFVGLDLLTVIIAGTCPE
jgi:Domain of unknown function (DUF6647)